MKFITVFIFTLFLISACGMHKDHDHPHKSAEKNTNKATGDKTVDPKLTEDKKMASLLVRRIFDDLNCEGGDVISPFEVDEHFSAIFLPVDTNQDRAISQEEFGNFYRDLSPEMIKKAFAKADKNNDGVMSSAEYREFLLDTLISLDANNDDELSREEVMQ